MLINMEQLLCTSSDTDSEHESIGQSISLCLSLLGDARLRAETIVPRQTHPINMRARPIEPNVRTALDYACTYSRPMSKSSSAIDRT